MKITDIRVTHVSLNYKGEVRLRRKSHDTAHGCFIHVETDEGLTGIGYAHASGPVVIGETPESIEAIVRSVYRAELLEEDPANIVFLLEKLDKVARYNTRARAAVDFALHDLTAKRFAVPLYSLLGGKHRSEIPVMRLLAIGSPESVAQEALKVIQDGYRYLKIKVGTDPETDVSRIKAVREAVGNAVTIVADANQGDDVKGAISVVNKMAQYGLAIIEQPVLSSDFKGLATIRRNVEVRVEADESARSLYDVMRLIDLEAVDFVSIKPPELGGLKVSQKVAALCEAANVGCLIGTTLGSQYVDAVGAHFAAATGNMTFGCELGEYTRLRDDPVSGLQEKDGCVTVPEGLGVGITLNLS